jgi:hypothetical protein
MKLFEDRSTGSKVEMGESQTIVCDYHMVMKVMIIMMISQAHFFLKKGRK